MDQIEIKTRNESIAKMLGWFKEADGSQPDTWFKLSECAKYVAYSEYNDKYKGLPFSYDYNFLMNALEFISDNFKGSNDSDNTKIGQFFIDRFELGLHKIFVTLIQWTEKGWRMFFDYKNKDLCVYYIIGENAENYNEMLFKAISDIATATNIIKE